MDLSLFACSTLFLMWDKSVLLQECDCEGIFLERQKPEFMKWIIVAILGMLVLTCLAIGCSSEPVPEKEGTLVQLQTTMGTITIRLDPDMPITTGNFEHLVREGFYDGTPFHRVIDGFMIQGGDPTGTGRGGPGYTIQDEFTDHNRNLRGTIAMANTGQPNSGGSQFFINLVDNAYLDKKHPVFGEVTEGMEVVDRVAKLPTDEADRPLQNVTIIRATVLE